jgi:hypothetical protein
MRRLAGGDARSWIAGLLWACVAGSIMAGCGGGGPADDDSSAGSDDDVASGDDDATSGDDDSSAGDDDATGGDDDATSGDDDAAGDDDAVGDDDVTGGDDDVTGGDDDQTGDDDSTDVGSEHCGTVDSSQTWTLVNSPHHVSCDVLVEGGAGPILTLEPGVEIRFDADTGLYVGRNAAGGLSATGTGDAPIVLDGSSSTDPGAWSGVWFGAQTLPGSAELSYVTIRHAGGANTRAGLEAHGAQLAAVHLAVEGSADYGLFLADGAGFVPGSTSLTLHSSGWYGMHIDARMVSTLPPGDFADNTIDGIELGDGTVSATARWDDPGAPFYVASNLYVQGDAGPVLTLGPGVVLAFLGGKGLYVAGDGRPGALAIEGTADDPVLLTTAGQLKPGFWSGVQFNDETIDAKSVLEHFTIEYGGGANLEADVELRDASPTLSDGVIRHSEQWGVCQSGASAPVLTGITYEDNASGDVCP